jgi:hypothetical protein
LACCKPLSQLGDKYFPEHFENGSFSMQKLSVWAVGVFVLAAVFLAPLAKADFSFGRSEAAQIGLSRAYGYVLAQEYSLKRIAQLYPMLQSPVQNAEFAFATTYGRSIKDKLAEYIAPGLGREKLREFTTKIHGSLEKKFSSTTYTKQESLDFVAEVNRRAKGQVDSSILPYLVATRYRDQPANEFSAKLLQRFNTQGHPKSLGLNMVIDLPVSWVAAEGERPHIVQKWQSMAGYGQQLITLDIRKTGFKVSPPEVAEFARGGGLKTFVPDGGTFIGGGGQTVEGQPGYWLDYSMVVERAGFNIYSIARINSFFIADKALSITCMVTTGQDQKAGADKDFVKVKALCPMVVNSVVIKDLY